MLDFLAQQVHSFLSFLIGLFPSGTGFPEGFHTAMATLGGYVHLLDPLVPMATLLTCVTLIFTVEIAIFGFKVLRWILSHVPFLGGKGV
ncbi:MAG: hypothetical protein WC603_02975 [Candidatus Paceibacterota bacterium]|jgi:hypothetical protein